MIWKYTWDFPTAYGWKQRKLLFLGGLLRYKGPFVWSQPRHRFSGPIVLFMNAIEVKWSQVKSPGAIIIIVFIPNAHLFDLNHFVKVDDGVTRNLHAGPGPSSATSRKFFCTCRRHIRPWCRPWLIPCRIGRNPRFAVVNKWFNSNIHKWHDARWLQTGKMRIYISRIQTWATLYCEIML